MSDKPQTNKQKAKCKYCDGEIPKGEGVKHGSRYFHEKCYEEWKEQADDRTQLIEYIMDLHNIDRPSGMMLKQIKEFQEEPYNYKLKGMLLALKYFHEIQGKPVLDSSGIGIVAYVYEQAKQYYIMKMGIKQSLKEFEGKQESRVVYIERPKNITKRKDTGIDINSL